MSVLTPVTASSIKTSVAATAATSSLTMAADKKYRFISTTACWIKQAAAAVIGAPGNSPATADSGSMYVGPNEVVLLDGVNGDKLSVIRNAADGESTLTPVQWW